MKIDRRFFIDELNATDEDYVRTKLMSGGYIDWQVDVANEWLRAREIKRQRRKDTTNAVLTGLTMLAAFAAAWVAYHVGK